MKFNNNLFSCLEDSESFETTVLQTSKTNNYKCSYNEICDIFDKDKKLYQKILLNQSINSIDLENQVKKICKIYNTRYPTQDPYMYDEAISLYYDEICTLKKLTPIFSVLNTTLDFIHQINVDVPQIITSKTFLKKSIAVFKRVTFDNVESMQPVCFITTSEELFCLQNIASNQKVNVFSCPLTTQDLDESSCLYDNIVSCSKQKTNHKIKNDNIKNLIASYNSKFPLWCFLFTENCNTQCIPFVKNDNDQTINSITVNLGDTDFLKYKNDISIFGNSENKKSNPGLISHLITNFSTNKFCSSVNCLIFNSTISICQTSTRKQYLKGCRIRFLTNEYSNIQNISNNISTSLNSLDQESQCCYSKLIINIIPRPTVSQF